MEVDRIKEYCSAKALRWTNHVLVRMMQRDIYIKDVEYALENGKIIEQYPTDYPYPSCLVLGVCTSKKFIHIVCGDSGTELWLITAYYPNENEWTNNFEKRKEINE